MGVMHPCHYPGCMKKFDRKYNLKCHLRIHSNEKPYRCHHENCTRSFRWKSSLNHHLMSLDHTSAAVRRARKARAQRRRMARTSPQTFVTQPPLDHHQQHVFDLPTLSPVSSVGTFSHSPSPQQRTVPDISNAQPRHFKLEHRLSPSDVATSSVPTTPLSVTQDLHFLNRNQISHNQPRDSVPIPSSGPLYSHTTPYRIAPSQVLRSGPTYLHSQPEGSGKVQTQHPIMAQLQDPLALPMKPLQHPLIPDTTVKNELRSFVDESSSPLRCTSEAETSIPSLADDTISLVTPSKKSEPVDFTSPSKVPVNGDLAALFDGSAGSTKDSTCSKVQGHKTPAPLVSIFEEFSPVSLMPFSSSLDTLFPANVDGSGMKSF